MHQIQQKIKKSTQGICNKLRLQRKLEHGSSSRFSTKTAKVAVFALASLGIAGVCLVYPPSRRLLRATAAKLLQRFNRVHSNPEDLITPEVIESSGITKGQLGKVFLVLGSIGSILGILAVSLKMLTPTPAPEPEMFPEPELNLKVQLVRLAILYYRIIFNVYPPVFPAAVAAEGVVGAVSTIVNTTLTVANTTL